MKASDFIDLTENYFRDFPVKWSLWEMNALDAVR